MEVLSEKPELEILLEVVDLSVRSIDELAGYLLSGSCETLRCKIKIGAKGPRLSSGDVGSEKWMIHLGNDLKKSRLKRQERITSGNI